MITRRWMERSWIFEKATLGIKVSPPLFLFTKGNILGKIQEILIFIRFYKYIWSEAYLSILLTNFLYLYIVNC